MSKNENFEGFMYQHRERDGLSHLDWIVGPVLTAYDVLGYPLSVVVMGVKSFAVVNYSTREIDSVYPTLKRAKQRANWLALAIDAARK